MKKALISASKRQVKGSPNRIFINESLTPKRTAVLQTLLKMKKLHGVISWVTSIEGDVYAFTPPDENSAVRATGAPKDKRHRINTREELQKFCAEYLQKPLEEFITTWPGL